MTIDHKAENRFLLYMLVGLALIMVAILPIIGHGLIHEFRTLLTRQALDESLHRLYQTLVRLGLGMIFTIVMASFLVMKRLVRRYERERERNVDQIEKHAREIEQANERLRELQESKNRLYAHLSHDLRAPLNSVVTACDLLKTGTYGPTTERQITAMDRVIRNAEVLVRLLDQILQLTKLETGQWEIEVVPFRLQTVIDNVVDNLRPLAEQKGIALGGYSEPESPLIQSDRDTIYLILQNLVGNALKFTDQGEVEVRARVLEDDRVEIYVRDTGPGIPPEECEQVFREFVVIKDREHGRGIGLGLSITRELTHQVGGVISVESEVGRGSTFTVCLPAHLEV